MYNFDGKVFSNEIVLTRVADGASASSFIINSDYDSILKFENDAGDFSFSPSVFKFNIINLGSTTTIKNFDWTFSFLNEDGAFINICSNSSMDSDANIFKDCFSYEKPIGE
jgi:hypothetical protein